MNFSWCDAYWRGAALLEGTFTSTRVIKDVPKVLPLLEEML